MADVSRVEYNDEKIIDLTEDTVTPISLRTGVTAHNAAGDLITGVGGGITVIDDSAGDGDWDKVWSADHTWNEINKLRQRLLGLITPAGTYYEGPFIFTPSDNKQIISVGGYIVQDDILINEIPYAEVSNPNGGYTVTIGE